MPTASFDHVLDPDGDIILLVYSPNEPFAAWDRLGSNDNDNQTTSSDCPPKETTFRVSSRHLKLSSSYFKRCLSEGWKNITVGDDGLCHIDTDVADPEAFLIAMNIIHNQFHKLPDTVPVETLAKLAAVVHLYGLHDPVGYFCNNWIMKYSNSLPNEFCRDLVLWIYISWVFKKHDIFRNVTGVAIRGNKGRMPTLGLPIPSSIISR